MHRLQAIYDAMEARNAALPVRWDAALQGEGEDPRRCLALVAVGRWHGEAPPDGMVPDGTIAYTADRDGGGVLHHTFMQLIGFDRYAEEVGRYDWAGAVAKLDALFAGMPRYTVAFSRVCRVPTGVVALGDPEGAAGLYERLERIRAEIRSDPALCPFEPYVNDIYHATLWRYTSEAGVKAMKDVAVGVRLRLEVEGMRLVHGSWCMREDEVVEVKRWAFGGLRRTP